jgi:hypothetical protein
LDGFSFWEYFQINNGTYLAKNLTRQKNIMGFHSKVFAVFFNINSESKT